MKRQFPKNVEVEVIAKKKMLYADFLKMIDAFRNKGWDVQAYEPGFWTVGCKKRIE